MNILKQQLGKPLTAKDLAKFFDVDVKVIRKNYKELGGMRLGERLYRFPEKGVINAVFKGWEMESPSQKKRKKKGENVQNKEGRSGMGKHDAPVRKRMEGGDRHNLLD